MSLRRAGTVFGLELSRQLRRPLFWILLLVLALAAWGLTSGNVRISSGDSDVGGQKAWLTSEFANGQMQTLVVFLFFSFFMVVAAGMSVIGDDELNVGGLIHSSGLRPGEYIWAKYAAVLAAYLGALAVWLVLSITCNHLLPNAAADKFRGPLELINYIRPAIIFGLPTIIFVTGAAFGAGAVSRRPILVFMFPVTMLVVVGFFLWDWSPSWLSPSWNSFLMLIEPAGFRWLSETWLKVDRGVGFYNHAAIPADGLLLANRLLFTALGLGSVAMAHRRFAASLRGAAARTGARRRRDPQPAAQAAAPAEAVMAGIAAMAMSSSPPGMLRGTWDVMRFELRGLLGQPGLYLFVPLILIQTIGDTLLKVGAFDTPVLLTPGLFAVSAMNTLSLLICLLMMFYTVESLERERGAGLAAIYYATPVRTWGVMLGKGLANAAVGVAVMAAAWLGGAIVQLWQGRVSLGLTPFVIVWGLLLVPTFLVWSAFISAVYAVLRSRYAAYAVGLAALIFTGWRQLNDQMSWVGNWMVWGTVAWSDMGTFEIDRRALWLNRIAALGLAALLFAITARVFPRREHDPARIVQRLRPAALGRAVLRLAPLWAVPAGVLLVLWFQVNAGFQSEASKDKAKDYWKKNLATWRDAKLPDITHVEMCVGLKPNRRSFQATGTYTLGNFHDEPLASIPLTAGLHWTKVSWTLNDEPYTPEDRQGLFVFTPPRPLAPGEALRIGFEYGGKVPPGISENGARRVDEFILPSGVVLTSFSGSFAPVVGWVEMIGVDEKNEYEPRVFTDDFYKGQTRSAFGGTRPHTTLISITGPESYRYNSVGILESETVKSGYRTAVWRSDHPVAFFNVVAGRWSEKRGDGTVIYYHPAHAYNLEEMSQALDAARRYYSEWFHPFPWAELKVSEFPGLASYAQGFPTNITFSESIGFLTRSTAKSRAAFFVTAHEAAHQWWGNILAPGEGPGGEILSEGMANFSTIMLMEQARGPHARIEFIKRLEDQYGERRQVDSEKPLVRINQRRAGDTTVMYDKGSWVFWMLQQLMGREANLDGLRDFMATWSQNPDHPVLEDFIATMRPHAPDAAAFDAFVAQWFFDVVIPEYRFSSVKREAAPGGGWIVTATIENAGTGRMPVEVAAARGERFLDQTEEEAALERAPLSPDYRDARTQVVLGSGEKAEISIRCDFEPDRLEVDPEAVVLQLQRKLAVAKL